MIKRNIPKSWNAKLLKAKVSCLSVFSFILIGGQSLSAIAQAQCPTSTNNPVVNQSFETQLAAPSQRGNMGQPYPSEVANWTTASLESPDYLSANAISSSLGVPSNDFGYQTARTGNSYAGIYQSNLFTPSKREYIKQQIPTLSAGQYYAEFYVSLSANSKHALYNFGLHVTNSDPTFSGNGVMPGNINPVISNNGASLNSSNWTKISGVFTANGTETYIVIGNFNQNDGYYTVNTGGTLNGAYYYIEDVSITKLPTAGSNITLSCPSIGVALGSTCQLPVSSGATYQWSANNDPGFSSNLANPVVNPSQTTVYTLTLTIPNGTGSNLVQTSTTTVYNNCLCQPEACNKIINSSFEGQLAAPSGRGNMGAPNPSEVCTWSTSSLESPDYCSTNATNSAVSVPTNDFGTRTPRTGNSYAGIYQSNIFTPSKREYIKQQIPTLAAGNYYAEFYVARSSNSRDALNTLGLHVMASDPYFTGNGLIPGNITPLVSNGTTSLNTTNWTKISGVFAAAGTENYVVIGNFNQNPGYYTVNSSASLNGAYYYIDDVSIFELPTAGVSETIKCAAEGIMIGSTNCPLPASSGATYSWTADNDPSFSSNQLNPTVYPNETTTYTLTVQIPTPGGSISTTTSSVTVTVNPPQIYFSLIGNTLFPNNSVDFEVSFANPADENDVIQYEWYIDGHLISGQTTKYFRDELECGEHTVTVRILTKCGWIWLKEPLTFYTCRDGAKVASYFTISPNPSTDFVNVKIIGTNLKNENQLKLIDSQGNIFLKIQTKERTLTLNIKDIPKGLYFIVVNDKKESIQRLIKK